jgi:HK97 family phage major capsid protein
VNEAIVRGDGNGKPLGILSSDALISVAAESGQASATIQTENVINMYSRLYGEFYNSAVWFINQDIIPQLYTRTVGSGAAVPVFIPGNDASRAPHGTLLGRPIVPTVECSALGTVGDIMLVDMEQYLTAVKTVGVKSDVSIHLYFDQDVTAFRFILRVAGQPLWNSAITPPNSANTKSWAIALATRS